MQDPEVTRQREDERAGRWSGVVTVAVAALFALPLLVALVALRNPRWYPSADLAQTEMRVRDVFSARPPLIGLSGRFGTFGVDQGSHLGPASFYATAPVHRLLGSTSWALQAAAAAVQLVAVGMALWLARRRGGVGLVLAVAAVLAILMRSYGAHLLTEAWIPHLPVLWWVVFILAVWLVLCDDLAVLPVAVGTGSFCLQSHISYAGPIVVTGAVAAVAVLGRLRSERRRRDVRWCVVALAVGIVAWLPPLIEQLTAEGEGNLGKVLRYFRASDEATLGVGPGSRRLLLLLDPWRLVANQTPSDGFPATGSWVPGAVLVAVWVGSVIVAWRLHHGVLLRLHLVLGVALVAAAASLTRVLGIPWNYLSLWVWGLGALLLLAVAWTVSVAVGPLMASRASPVRTALLPGLVVVGFLGLLVADASSVSSDDDSLSVVVGALAPPVLDHLDSSDGAGGGRDGRYRVTSTDAVFRDFPVFGIVNELERAGLDIGMDPGFVVAVRRHRVIQPGEATAVVHLSSGSDIARWRAKQGVTEAARFDPRTARQRRQSEVLRADVVRRLEDADLDDLVAVVDDIEVVAADPRISPAVQLRLNELSQLGAPIVAFVGPPDARD